MDSLVRVCSRQFRPQSRSLSHNARQKISRCVPSENSKPNRYPTTSKHRQCEVEHLGQCWVNALGDNSALAITRRTHERDCSTQEQGRMQLGGARRLHFSQSCHKCICCKASIAEKRTDRLLSIRRSPRGCSRMVDLVKGRSCAGCTVCCKVVASPQDATSCAHDWPRALQLLRGRIRYSSKRR